MNGLRGIALVLLCFATPLAAWGDEYRLKFVPNPDPKETISDLKWDESKDTQEPVLQIREKKQEGPLYFVILHGRSLEVARTLLFKNQPIALESGGRFTIKVEVDQERQEFTINEVDESGNITTQKSELLFPEWQQFKTSLKEPLPKRWSISPGLGVTIATYQQTGVSSFTQTVLSLKVAADYALPGRWDIGASAYYTVLPLSTTQSGMTLQFLGVNLRAGFRVLRTEQSWGLSLMGGAYYATTFSSGSFGYRNLQGPQLYPVLRKKFSGDKSAWVYLKYSPILTVKGFVGLNNAEFAFGTGYAFKAFSNRSVLAATVDIALLSLPGNPLIQVQSNTYTLGISYRF